MPWVKMSCMGERRSASGANLSGVFWIIFGAAVLILLAFIYFNNQKQLKKATPFVVLSAMVSFIIMIWKYVQISNGIKSGFGKITARSLHLSVDFGLIFTIIGFIVSIIGLAYLNDESDTIHEDKKSNIEISKDSFDVENNSGITKKSIEKKVN